MDYMTLLGAEDVQRASRTIQSAADSLQQAAGSIGVSVERFEHAVLELGVVLREDREERKQENMRLEDVKEFNQRQDETEAMERRERDEFSSFDDDRR